MGTFGMGIRLVGIGGAMLCVAPSAQNSDSLPTPAQLKRLSLEELMDVKVTLVSRQAEELSRTASSIQVITREEIRRAGIFTLPEALRLASNLQVARIDARQWAITARGQNASTADKLLVMIDGRSVYTPLYAGVFWDAQDVLIDNIDHIEVISGPGGALWGANAVNGVINIVTRPAGEMHGGYATVAGGTFVRDLEGVRAGGRVAPHVHAYAWGRRFRQMPSETGEGRSAGDGWEFTQNGFRADWTPDERDRLTLIGGLHQGWASQAGIAGRTQLDGQNLELRWNRETGRAGSFQFQAYFDRTARLIPSAFDEDLRTWDIDFQHGMALGERNRITWGAGYRLSQDEVDNGLLLQFRPAYRNLRDLNLFAQDQVEVWPDRVRLTLGARLQHTAYTGFEIMPSGRAAWTPDSRQTLWAAVSRAVRAPSRIDVDFHVPRDSASGLERELLGGPDFGSEYLMAYEAGWRARLGSAMSVSLSSFYNRYTDLRILAAPSDTVSLIANGGDQDILGLEADVGWQVASWWQMRFGAMWMTKDFRYQEGKDYLPAPGIEGQDPDGQYSLRWMFDLPRGFTADLWARYVSALTDPGAPYYATLGVSLGWTWRGIEVMISGQDLSERRHAEFGNGSQARLIPRSAAARIGARF